MDVVGIANPCIDFLINIDQFPKTNNGALLRDYSWQGGGKVSTALVALGRLGISTGILAVVGADSFGKFLVGDFNRHGVDTSRMVMDPQGTTHFSVPVSEIKMGGRSFLYSPGTCRKLAESDLDAGFITQARYLHLENMEHVSKAAAVLARQNGMKVVIDADHAGSAPLESLPFIDVLIASEFYYEAHFKSGSVEENCRQVLGMGPEVVVFTFGERGCAGMDKDGFFELPAFRVQAADTTGAGDVFHGAFLYGMLQGWSTKESSRFASAVSAIKCTRLGGRAGIPDVETTRKFLDTGIIDYTDIDKRVAFYKSLPASDQ